MSEKKTTKAFDVGKISLPLNTKKTPFVPEKTNFLQTGADKDALEAIAACIKLNKPVLLVGPTGCGKTATIRHLAQVTNNSYRRSQLNGATTRENFVGQILLDSNGGTYWVDGILTEAMKKGYWLLVDEINAALPEITMILNSVLDDDKTLVIEENQMEVVKPHPNFRLFAGMNPTEDYAGTKELNLALKNRFQIINYNYPTPDKEVEIISKHTGIDKHVGAVEGFSSKGLLDRMVEYANTIRKLNADQELVSICSTRQLISWAELVEDLGVKRACHISVINAGEAEENKKLTDELNKMFRTEETLEFYPQKIKENEEKKKKEAEKKRKATKDNNSKKTVKSGEDDIEEAEIHHIHKKPINAVDVDDDIPNVQVTFNKGDTVALNDIPEASDGILTDDLPF